MYRICHRMTDDYSVIYGSRFIFSGLSFHSIIMFHLIIYMLINEYSYTGLSGFPINENLIFQSSSPH